MTAILGRPPQWELVDLDQKRIGAKVQELMPPNFNTGWRANFNTRWRAPIWWIMTKVALALTRHDKTPEETGEGFHGAAQAAYRVGSAMWLVVFCQVLLIAAALVASVGGITCYAELYDPQSRTWSATGSLAYPRLTTLPPRLRMEESWSRAD